MTDSFVPRSDATSGWRVGNPARDPFSEPGRARPTRVKGVHPLAERALRAHHARMREAMYEPLHRWTFARFAGVSR